MRTIRRLLPIWAVCCCLHLQAQSQDSMLHKSGVHISAASRITYTGKQVTLRTILDSCLTIPHSIAPAAYHLPRLADINVREMPVTEFLHLLEQQFPITYAQDRFLPNVLLVLPRPGFTITGVVTGHKGEPLIGASVWLTRAGRGTMTGTDGVFSITCYQPDTLISSFTGMQSATLLANADRHDTMRLTYPPPMKEMVLLTDGYLARPTRYLTGSYYVLPSLSLKTSAAFNYISRLDGWSPHYQVKGGDLNGPLPGAVRGPGTFGGDRYMLLVMDHFPVQVNSHYFNPDDIERVTLVRDAAAALIYGYKGSNGVMVATTRQPVYKKMFRVSVKSQVTTTARPNARYRDGIGSADYLALEKRIFDSIKAPLRFTLSPAQDIYYQQKMDQITPVEAAEKIAALSRNDQQAAINHYFLAPGWHLHQGAVIEVANTVQRGYVSLSWSDNRLPEKGNRLQRYTGLGKWGLRHKRWELESSIFHSRLNTTQNAYWPVNNLPYLALTDSSGQAMSIPYERPPGYLEALPTGRLLNWKHYPLEEAAMMDNTNRQTLTQWWGRVGYQLPDSGLRLELMAQGTYTLSINREVHAASSYFTRNLINLFAQPSIYPVPLGAIADQWTIASRISNIRAQASFTRRLGIMYLMAYGGMETRTHRQHRQAERRYGMAEDSAAAAIDYTTLYPLNGGATQLAAVPRMEGRRDSSDNYLGYYVNGNLMLADRINLSVGVRKDMTNHFTRSSNRTAKPLWAIGSSVEWGTGRWRVSYGQTGNIDYTVAPFATMEWRGSNAAGNMAVLNQLPANNLTYERQYMLNTGLDISDRRRQLTGSIDVYRKVSRNLVMDREVNVLSGQNIIKSNAGAMQGWGVDVSLRMNHRRTGAVCYVEEQLLYGYTHSSIISDMLSNVPAWWYMQMGQYLTGTPPNALYAYPYAGLNAQGVPMGWYQQKQSTDYNRMFTDTAEAAVRYMGPSAPAHYASWVQSWHYKAFTLRYMLVFKAGYVFRRRALHYYALYNLRDIGSNRDYQQRWQQPGDEERTVVPGIPNTLNQWQDDFYQYSTANVVKGDHLRLKMVQLEYAWKQKQLSLTCYNLPILWRANPYKLDPDAGSYALPATLSTSMSFTAYF